MAGFGFSMFEVYLLNIPMGAIVALFLLGSSYLSTKFDGYRTIAAAALGVIR